MRIFEQSKIDWSQAQHEPICATRRDLPANIRAIEVAQMDLNAIQEASRMAAGLVQIVQIEVAETSTLRSQWQRYAQSTSAKFTWTPQSDATPEEHFRQHIESQPHLAPEYRSLTDDFALMIGSARAAGKKICDAMVETGPVSNAGNFNFHVHGINRKKPAWALTRPEGEQASVFADAQDVVTEQSALVRFKTDQPTIWMGKPGSYFYFAAGANPQGRAPHSWPRSAQHRAVPIAHIEEVSLQV